VKGSVSTSKARLMICPLCEEGELCLARTGSARCDSCVRTVEGVVVRTLEHIAGLPDALGGRACECGHPEMRLLPDGVFHCPACGAEVIPLEASSARIHPSA
jgi:ribosomal protein L37AE/L43A